MRKPQILITLAALLLCVLLAFAPKYVVDNNNDENSLTASGSETAESTGDQSAHVNISGDIAKKIEQLKLELESANLQKGSSILTSLVETYKSVNAYDSAAIVAELFAEKHNNFQDYLKAGDLYYEAYTFAVNQERVTMFSSKLRALYQKAEELNSLPADARVRLGMTYVSGDNPMKGITMIREVLRDEPNNTTAIFNLGLLSMQSGQYSKAVDRFKKLKEIQPDNLQAMFYLGIAYLENGQEADAKEELTALKKLETDPQILETVESYLSRIK